MVAATLRHLKSIRLMVCLTVVVVARLIQVDFGQRRDSGWIHTLLEEAENERMHLMCFTSPSLCPHSLTRTRRTFFALRKPGIGLRALVLAAQGVFYNIFCMPCLSFLPLKPGCSPNASPFVHRLSQDQPPFCRLPRRRGRKDVYARY